MNLQDMFKLIDKNELVLPDFQRNFVWNKSGQAALAASVLLDLPIGSFLILQGNKDDFATKKLGFSTEEVIPTDECKFLLDGQQRLTSLISIFGNLFDDANWKDIVRGIYEALKNKWFICVVPKGEEEDIFGWNDLIFNEEKLKNIEPTQIEEMIVSKTIGITKTNCWWNPDYSFLDDMGNKITRKNGKIHSLHVSKEMAKEHLLPLSVYNENDRTLLNYSLEIISKDRAMELKAKLEENLSEANKLLEKANIDTIIEEVTKENLDDLLNELRQKWKVSISTYLTKILEKTEAQIISLKSNEIGRAIIIFERINKGGTKLDNFDLVVARAARSKSEDSLTKRIIQYFYENLKLSDALCCHIKGEKPNSLNLSNMEMVKNNEINSQIKNQYLNLLSILSYVEYGNVDEVKIELTKKEKILNISYQQINEKTPKALKGLSRAYAFLQIRCGIVKISELHYKLMILPIAYLLINDEIWESREALDKIEYWYWGSIFAGEYRMYQNQVCIDDVRDLYKWIIENEKIKRYMDLEAEIFTIKDFSDSDTLMMNDEKEIPIAILKGILQYELSKQPVDLLYNNIILNSWDIASEKETMVNGKKIKITVQDHHIIPLATCTNLQESTRSIRNDKLHYLNSVLNRTYILSETNNVFSSNAPSKYLKKLEEDNNTYMLNSHFIPEKYKEYLNSEAINNEYKVKEFYKLRLEKIKTILFDEMNNLKN